MTVDADGDTTLPSDWYLRLGGAITQMFHGTIPISPAIPIKPTDPVVDLEFSGKRNFVPELRLAKALDGILFSGNSTERRIVLVDVHGHKFRNLRSCPKGIYYAQLAGTTLDLHTIGSICFTWMGK